MNDINTLWKILELYGVEIPPIQRDYAQGRETMQVNKIRENFLNSIFDALDNDKRLMMDFVYGKIHGLKNEEEHLRNRNAIQSLINSVRDYALTIDLTLKDVSIEDKSVDRADLVYLVPLDGQQRLTTLFLIHWYLAKRIGLQDELTILSRFRYKTRKSSSSFLNLLTSSELLLNFPPNVNVLDDLKEGNFYNEIIDSEYFARVWLNDPTVKAMLIMLQEIHNKCQSFSKEKLRLYWDRLIYQDLLQFDFLDLKDFNLSDELYVKMNARGKQLSNFENFKAWLYSVIEDESLIERELWTKASKKFDIEWNDIFWSFKEKGTFNIDNSYFNYFKTSLLYDAVKHIEIKGTSFDQERIEYTIIDTVINKKEFDWESLCGRIFKGGISKYLHLLSLCEGFVPVKGSLYDFYDFLFSEKRGALSWQQLIKNYITLSFLSFKSKSLRNYDDDEFDQLYEYQRIVFNLFDNSIIDHPNLYQSAFLEIDQLNNDLRDKEYNIADWIEGIYSSKSVFNDQQILEEILKYRLFFDAEWRRLINDAEKITYFERQLNFWFYKVGIPLGIEEFNPDFLNDHHLKNSFCAITHRINKLFDEKGINRTSDFSGHIFERALLSKSDYLLWEKGYKCFGRNLGRDVSWKRLFFRDRNSQETNIGLLEIFDLDFSDVQISFGGYIQQNLATINEEWREVFVSMPSLFDYLGDLKYIRHIDVHG
ncbi:GmrSD restriction endonuclease domain-containing protein [Sphingobacterium multivorum]|uniref:GmrSD restriction endonuclease domain-containing protein n=1 Tax=Sphingobacterium multivorum TaxID=28454 RepID=UPI003DA233EE